MLGTNASGGNKGGNQAPNQGNLSDGTSIGMAANPPLIPYMVSLSLPDFS